MSKSEQPDKQHSKKTARQSTAKTSAAKQPAPTRRKQATPAKRHYLPADERRQRILESSREVFARTGLQGARTRDLAKAAGINQATLFAHFASKEELFAAAVLQPLAALFDGIRERYQVYQAAHSPQDLLGLLQGGMQKHLENMIEIFPLLVHALSDQEMGKKLYAEQILPMVKSRSEFVRSLVKDTLNPELVELASFGMFFAVAMDHVMTGKKHDLGNVSHQLADLLILGCAGNQWNAPRDTVTKKRTGTKTRAKTQK